MFSSIIFFLSQTSTKDPAEELEPDKGQDEQDQSVGSLLEPVKSGHNDPGSWNAVVCFLENVLPSPQDVLPDVSPPVNLADIKIKDTAIFSRQFI